MPDAQLARGDICGDPTGLRAGVEGATIRQREEGTPAWRTAGGQGRTIHGLPPGRHRNYIRSRRPS
jgi:hypothetical protein